MASRDVLPLCSLASVLLVVFSSALSAASDEKVKLDLYYETLCPYCSNFMANSLPKIFDNGLVDIVDLNLVPFGNARVGSNNKTITCQHGPAECLLNTVEACAIHLWPDVNKHFPFLQCVESLVHIGKYKDWELCYQKTGFDPKPITNCKRNGQGEQLILQYAKETNSLVPPHQFVPWVVVNGKPLEQYYDEFMTAVCEAYRGNHVPKYCEDLPLQITLNARETNIKHVCHLEKATVETREPVPPPALDMP